MGYSFMAATPSSVAHTLFAPDAYRVALRWWLGLPLLLEGQQGSQAQCPGFTQLVDCHGDHLLCCKRNNFSKRHLAVQDALAAILSDAGQPFHKEVVIPECPDGQLRPADLLLTGWQGGQDTAVDVTVVHGWQQSEQSANPTRERWRTFLTRKERAKTDKYMRACQAAGWAFTPMAFGTWGGLGPEAAKLLGRATQRAASRLEGDFRTRRKEELRINLGLALVRHVWALLNNKNLISATTWS